MLDFPERRLLLRAFVSAVVGLTLIAWNILGIDHKSEEASTDVFLHAAAPLLGPRLSPYPITVVLVTPHAIDRLNREAGDRYKTAEKTYEDGRKSHPEAKDPGPAPVKQIWSWPFSFTQQAQLLDAITADRPRAVFYDVAFYQPRNGGSQPMPVDKADSNAFADSIRDATGLRGKADPRCLDTGTAGSTGIPIFLSLVSDATVIPALCEAGAQGVRVEWTAAHILYPLDRRRLGDTGVEATEDKLTEDNARAPQQPQFLTAAARLFVELCTGPARQGQVAQCPPSRPALPDVLPLAVAWSNGVDPAQDDYADTARCTVDAGRSFFARVGEALGALFADVAKHGDSIETRCFNTRFLPVDQVLSPFDKQALARALSGQVVMVGTGLTGLSDQIYSPAQGQVPGIFLHATALENLLRWGADHYRDIDEGGIGWWLLQIASCAIVTAMIYGTVRAIEWFRRNPPSLQLLAYSSRGPGRRLVKDALVDVLQLVTLAAAVVGALLALTLIGFFAFHIAPLNWVGMAALVLGLTLDEIGGTAADALVVLAMTLSPVRKIARTFFPHPSLE